MSDYSCYCCRYYSGSALLPCAVHPGRQLSELESPNCQDWEQEVLVPEDQLVPVPKKELLVLHNTGCRACGSVTVFMDGGFCLSCWDLS